MVAHNFHVVRAIILPHKTYPPLVVNADTVLPAPVAFQRLQLIARRRLQGIQLYRGLQHQQLAPRHPLNIPETGNHMAEKQVLGIGTFK